MDGVRGALTRTEQFGHVRKKRREKVLSLREQLLNKAKDCYEVNNLSYDKHDFENEEYQLRRKRTKQWIHIDDVFAVLGGECSPSHKELHELLEKRPMLEKVPNKEEMLKHIVATVEWFNVFVPKLEAVLQGYARREKLLDKLTQDFPSLTESHASFPIENMLVWRAKVVMWYKRLCALKGDKKNV